MKSSATFSPGDLVVSFRYHWGFDTSCRYRTFDIGKPAIYLGAKTSRWSWVLIEGRVLEVLDTMISAAEEK